MPTLPSDELTYTAGVVVLTVLLPVEISTTLL